MNNFLAPSLHSDAYKSIFNTVLVII